MKAYLLQVLVIDHDELGADEIKDVLEHQKYPNWCMYPRVVGTQEAELGEWRDDHPLNCVGADHRLFFQDDAS